MRRTFLRAAYFYALCVFGLQASVRADEIVIPGETYTNPDWIGPWVINSILDPSSCVPASGTPFEHEEPEKPGSPPVTQAPFSLTGSPPTLGANFKGQRFEYTGNASFVPDTMGAVGPNHFVEVTNKGISIFSKLGGPPLASASLLTFFCGSGAPGVGSQWLADPRVVFDHHSERWIITVTDTDARIGLAISLSSDPMGNFFKTSFVASAGSDANAWPDYPTLGVNAYGIFVSADMSPNDVGGQGTGSTIWAIDKTSLLGSSPVMGTITVWRGLNVNTVQPAHTYGPDSSEYLITKRNQSELQIYRVDAPLDRVMDFCEGKPMFGAWQGGPTQATSRMTNGRLSRGI